MSKTEQSKATYNKKAQDYDNTPEGRFTIRFKQELVNSIKLKQYANVLDVACGNGTLLGMLGSKTQINGYGIDISENMITEARKLNPEFQYAVSGCDKLPFDNITFDVITVSASFHHFEQPDLFLKEAKRVLKQGGELFIAELYWPTALRIIGNLLFPLLKSGDVKVYSPKELETMLLNNGFSGVSNTINDHIQIARGAK